MAETDTKLALVFPGQGSQYVGMGADLYDASPAARAVFAEADVALGFPLSRLCFEGPEEDLIDTANAQPAIVTVSLATLACLREELASRDRRLAANLVAGHSVGQYAALAAADVLDCGTAIGLVGKRGRLMKEAGALAPGGMAAILGLDEEGVAAVCREAATEGTICPANFNMPGQIVVSGDAAGLAAATRLAVARGARKVVPLAVSVANHSPLMTPAASQFSSLLAELPLRNASVPLVANGDARRIYSAEAIRYELLRHMTGPVRWTDSVMAINREGVDHFWEIGPGQVLAGLIKRTIKTANVASVGSLEAVRAVAESYAGQMR